MVVNTQATTSLSSQALARLRDLLLLVQAPPSGTNSGLSAQTGMNALDALHQSVFEVLRPLMHAATTELKARLQSAGFLVSDELRLVDNNTPTEDARESLVFLRLRDPATSADMMVGVQLQSTCADVLSETTHVARVIALMRPRRGHGNYAVYKGIAAQWQESKGLMQELDELKRQLNQHALLAVEAMQARCTP